MAISNGMIKEWVGLNVSVEDEYLSGPEGCKSAFPKCMDPSPLSCSQKILQYGVEIVAPWMGGE